MWHQNIGYYINLIKAVAVSACIKLSLQPQTFAEVKHLINMLLNYWVIGWLIVHNACDVFVLSHSDMSDILRPPTDCSPPGSSVHGDLPGRNTGVGCHVLLQGIFPTQGLNPGLPHFRWILYHEPPGKLKNTAWVVYPFSKLSSWSKDWPAVSCIAGRFPTSWAAREGPFTLYPLLNFSTINYPIKAVYKYLTLTYIEEIATAKFATMQKMFTEWNFMHLNHKMACFHFVTRGML